MRTNPQIHVSRGFSRAWLLLLVSASFLAAEPTAPKAEKAWSFRKPTAHELVAVKNESWVRNPIDRFVLEKLEANELQPAPEASRRTLVRRLYFNLLGLPPTPEDVEKFVANDDPNAYSGLVDQLLDDPRYGERWARHWLDLARYADTAGYEGDPDVPHTWRYRDYVIDAFNTDKPYDVFVTEQIAGDEVFDIMGAGGLPTATPERMVAMTFLRLAPFTEPRGDETRHEMLSEMTATVSSVFLGLTVGCAKCHDHKYDPIPTKDFYRMKAFFATVQIAPPAQGDIFQIGSPMAVDFYRPDEKERTTTGRQAAEEELAQRENEFDSLAKALQKKLTEARKADEPIPLSDVRRAVGRKAKELTAEEIERYQDLRRLKTLLRARIRRLQPMAHTLRHSVGPPYEPGVPTSHVMVRGEYDHKGEIVEPGFLSAITGNQQPAKIRLDPFKRWPTRGRRLALAQWIANGENPLTARVMVNRIWQHHFGRGIVATPSDFGNLGAPPTHPQLLDWLALQFVTKGWSIKEMHRLILNSATYRQRSSWKSEKGLQVDDANELLWRFPRQRLEGEVIRDSVLAVSGRLNPEQFGVPVFPPLPEEVDREIKWNMSKWDTANGPESRRRSIYVYQQRSLNMPFLDVFDAKVLDMPCDQRAVSVTALQSLEMYNGPFVNTEANYFSERVKKEAGAEPRKQIERAYALALSRRPTEDEIDMLREFMSSVDSPDTGLVGMCRILMNTNEFIYVD